MTTPRDYNTSTNYPIIIGRTDYDFYGENVVAVSQVLEPAASFSLAQRVGNNTSGWRTLLKKRSLQPDNPYFIKEVKGIGYGPLGGSGYIYLSSEKLFATRYRGDSATNPPLFCPVVTYTGKAYWRCISDPMEPPNIAPFEAVARSRAINKVLLLLKDSKFNGAVAYNEAGQVQKLIGDSARKIAKVLTDLKHGRLQSAMKEIGLVSSKRQAARYRKAMSRAKDRDAIETVMAQGVLMVQYGIRPLLNDIVGAAELYAQKTVGEVATDIRASSTVSLEDGRTKSGTSSYSAYGPYTYYSYCKTSGTVRVSIKIRYSRGNETTHTLAQLGITNPALVAWEAMPWSFVIDWFIPIGNWVSSLDATLGLTFQSGCISTKHDMSHIRGQNVTGHVISSGQSEFKSQRFQRERLSSFPSPSFPSFKNPLSMEHALNGIALLVGVRNNLHK